MGGWGGRGCLKRLKISKQLPLVLTKGCSNSLKLYGFSDLNRKLLLPGKNGNVQQLESNVSLDKN